MPVFWWSSGLTTFWPIHCAVRYTVGKRLVHTHRSKPHWHQLNPLPTPHTWFWSWANRFVLSVVLHNMARFHHRMNQTQSDSDCAKLNWFCLKAAFIRFSKTCMFHAKNGWFSRYEALCGVMWFFFGCKIWLVKLQSNTRESHNQYWM